jgi:hypothetical protein
VAKSKSNVNGIKSKEMILSIGTSFAFDLPLIKEFEAVISINNQTILIISKN